MHILVKDNHSCVESYLPEGCHQNKKRGTETTCTKSLHTKGFRNKLNGLQALCPLSPCLESSLISDGVRSDTSILLSLLLSALFFGWDLVFSLLDVCVTCALFLYFSCFKKKKKIFQMLPFSSYH